MNVQQKAAKQQSLMLGADASSCSTGVCLRDLYNHFVMAGALRMAKEVDGQIVEDLLSRDS